MTDLPKSYLQPSFEVTTDAPLCGHVIGFGVWQPVIWLWYMICFAGFRQTNAHWVKTDSLNDHNKNCHKIRFSHVLTRLTSRTTYNHNSGLKYSHKSRTIYILCHHRVPIWLLSHVKYWTIVNSKFSFIIATIKNIFI